QEGYLRRPNLHFCAKMETGVRVRPHKQAMGFQPGAESYEIIIAGITAVLLAQVFKLLTHAIKGKRFNFRILSQTGGMPSSHSAGMCSMATSVGLINGFDSSVFAVAFGIAAIVMYDAAGLRQAAGRMAGIL